jgi:D-alanyl-D-alanine carboxypeptidase/D-alanyl-D-alanine-endopeptidase (penicillin-binding protein 4)
MVESAYFQNAHWGILIVDPEAGDTLYSRNAGKLFMPASNMKIVTGAVALALLGPDFRFRTTYAVRGTRRGSLVDGDLVVHGRGDPSLSERMRGDALQGLRDVADSLAARGISRVAGRIVAGSDVFPGAMHGAGWAWDDLVESYSAGVDELFFSEGFSRITVRAGDQVGVAPTFTMTPSVRYPVVGLTATTVAAPDSSLQPGGRTGSASPPATALHVALDSATGTASISGTIAARTQRSFDVAHPHPRSAFLAALGDALSQRGILVGGTVRPPGRREDTLFTQLSPPLRAILAAMEKPSQNQIAEILLKTLGLEKAGIGVADSGRAIVERQLLAWGVDSSGFVVRDGSGLSRYNYLTPETVVRVLGAIRRDSAFQVFYDALPIAGVDGTISGRMKGTPAEGNARAKTGFIANARSLSGYVTTANGRMLLFSLMCNNWTAPRREIERVQDAVTARLAALATPP